MRGSARLPVRAGSWRAPLQLPPSGPAPRVARDNGSSLPPGAREGRAGVCEQGMRGAGMFVFTLVLALHPHQARAFSLGSLFPHGTLCSGTRLFSTSPPAWGRIRGGGMGSGAGGAKAAMLIPAGTAEAEIKVKNSRFIGIAGYAPSTEKAREFIAEVKDKYPDARHHCYAFVVGHGASVNSGMGDDGEPSGTAGRPILSVLTGGGSELGDCCVVVVRYFGGTKLGTGGLVKAYTEATQVALLALELTEKVDMCRVRVKGLGYDHYAKVRGPLEGLGCTIEEEVFGEDVDMTVAAEESKTEQVTSLIRDASSGKAEVSEPRPIEP